MTTRSKIKNDCVSCQIEEGILTINGPPWGYYVSRDGTRMLVLECSADQRIRLNGTIEIVVIETCNGEVQLGIDDAAYSDRNAPRCVVRCHQPDGKRLLHRSGCSCSTHAMPISERTVGHHELHGSSRRLQ